MFDSLSEKLQSVFKRLRDRGALTERDVDEALREIRLVLLEADVNFRVVKDFIARLRERAVGQEVLQSLSPAQQVVKIVNEQLVELFGGEAARMATAPKPPTVVMLIGLQGSGKTTSAAKLANMLKKQGRNPLLVAADVKRPAAVEQLQALGSRLGVNVYSGAGKNAVTVCRDSVAGAHSGGHDYVLLDTAGRLHIDEELMAELAEIKSLVRPHEILLVVDAMTGQDAVNVAQEFNEKLDIDGVLLTKLDGDARGGAALSVKAVTGKPIKFVGTSEKMDGLEPFHPDRMASRILGMGDVLSFIEKAEEAIDEEKAKELERKLRQNEFDFEDYLDQLQQMKKMGPLDQLLGMIPGLGGKLKDVQIDEGELRKVEAIIRSMTIEERRTPSILTGSRKRRIALGSGTSPRDINRLLKQFEEAKKMIRTMSGMGEAGRRKAWPFSQGF
ncbi:MAG: signal recognition particle protein [Armatimonadota bacterium]|nr:signal recognition particle protein [Armatimonadota bacterium]